MQVGKADGEAPNNPGWQESHTKTPRTPERLVSPSGQFIVGAAEGLVDGAAVGAGVTKT